MREAYFLGINPQGFHRVVYDEWNQEGKPETVVCLHGLTRNAKDLHPLARDLQRDFRVICPDLVGRGRSDYFGDGRYSYPQYLSDINALLARLDVEELSFVGTSLGGVIGLMLAGLPGSPIKKLVLNDVTPFIPKQLLKRLAKYVPQQHTFKTLEEVLAFLVGCLPCTLDVPKERWEELVRDSVHWDAARELWVSAYDPYIAPSFAKPEALQDLDFWSYWEQVKCPVLLLHGEKSDMVLPEAVARMKQKADVTTVSFADRGHPLSLSTPEQIKLVHDWLLAQDA